MYMPYMHQSLRNKVLSGIENVHVFREKPDDCNTQLMDHDVHMTWIELDWNLLSIYFMGVSKEN